MSSKLSPKIIKQPAVARRVAGAYRRMADRYAVGMDVTGAHLEWVVGDAGIDRGGVIDNVDDTLHQLDATCRDREQRRGRGQRYRAGYPVDPLHVEIPDGLTIGNEQVDKRGARGGRILRQQYTEGIAAGDTHRDAAVRTCAQCYPVLCL